MSSSVLDNAARQATVRHGGFHHHLEHEHNMEHYMDFIFLVRSKDPQDYTGPEQRIKARPGLRPA